MTLGQKKKLNKYSKTEAFNNCIFENHPKILQNSEKIIYTPGIIKDDTLYIKVLRNKKICSKIDLFDGIITGQKIKLFQSQEVKVSQPAANI